MRGIMSFRMPGGVPLLAQRRQYFIGLVALSFGISVLAGCAGLGVSNIVATGAPGPSPSEILVDVAAPNTGSAKTNVATDAATQLRDDLIHRLGSAHAAAAPATSAPVPPGMAVLHVVITEADSGSYLERFAIGFGLGRAELRAKINFETVDREGARTVVAFDASRRGGRVMPGFVLPAAISIATLNPIPVVVGGSLKLVTSTRGMNASTKGMAKAIVKELKNYYASVGWHWPGDKA